MVFSLRSNGTVYVHTVQGPHTEADLYGFPNTWKWHDRGSGWRYDYRVLLLNVAELTVFCYLTLVFIDVASRFEKRRVNYGPSVT